MGILSRGNTQNATCASRSKSGSYRTLQIRTTHVLMWDRIEISVPLNSWYPQELHGNPKTLSLIFRNFSLIVLKSYRIKSLEKKLAFLLCKGMNFPLRLGLSCSFLPLTATKLAMVLGESNIRLGVGLDFLLQHQARYPHLTQPKNPEIQVFLWTFTENLVHQYPVQIPAMAEHKVVALPPFKNFLAVIESLKAVRPLTPCSVKNIWPKSFESVNRCNWKHLWVEGPQLMTMYRNLKTLLGCYHANDGHNWRLLPEVKWEESVVPEVNHDSGSTTSESINENLLQILDMGMLEVCEYLCTFQDLCLWSNTRNNLKKHWKTMY